MRFTRVFGEIMIRHGSLRFGAVGAFAVLLSLSSPFAMHAQMATSEVADFAFVVKSTDDSIELACVKGCAWETLSFSARVDGTPQAVDQYGMSTCRDGSSEEQNGLANFLFTIQRSADGLRLQGKRGSAWEALSFSCRSGGCEQGVDQFGMIPAETR